MQPDRRYNGVLTGGAMIQTQKGTPGLQLMIAYEDDDGFAAKTTAMLWLTDKALVNTKRTLKALGVDAEGQGETYWENVGAVLEGIEVTFTTKEEEYPPGEFKTRVAYVNPRTGNSLENEAPARVAARLFGGQAKLPPPGDEEVPF